MINLMFLKIILITIIGMKDGRRFALLSVRMFDLAKIELREVATNA